MALTAAPESKVRPNSRQLTSPASSDTSSSRSLPARIPSLPPDERKRLNDEAFVEWKKTKAKQEAEKRDKIREERERIEQEKREKEERQKKIEEDNRLRWLQRKHAQSAGEKQKKLESQRKVKAEQDEKRRFSKEIVATWMSVAKNRSKPVKGHIFENPRMKFVNPIPWNGVLEE